MLERLLYILRQGGSHTVAGLAKQLDTTPAMIDVLLEDLSQRGYLQTVGGDCSTQCKQCPLGGSCSVGGAKQVWSLTEKGQGGTGKT